MNHNNELEYILKPLICDTNYFSCSYQTGRWPKPHDCGLPEALKAVTAHFNKKFEECLPEKEQHIESGRNIVYREGFNEAIDQTTHNIKLLLGDD